MRTFFVLQKETAWSDGGDGNDIFIPVLDGDYSVNLDDPLREQQHVVGDSDSQFIVQDIRNLGGDLKMGLWPHLALTQFDMGAKRVSGQMESYAGRYVYPGLETRVHKGLMAERIQVSGQNGGDIMVTVGWAGAWEETAAALTYPGALTIPSIPSLLFKNCRFVISLDAGSTFANRIVPVGLESFEVTLANNLKRGPAVEDRITAYKDGRVEFFDAGRRKVDLRYTAAFDRLAYSTLQRSRLLTQFKMLGAHPSYTGYLTVDVAGAVAGTAVAIPTTTDPALASPAFQVNDYVMFDNAGGTSKPCVGKVTAVDSIAPFGITIDTLDEDVVSGDHVFNAAVELKTAPCRANTTIDKAFDDYVKVTVTGQAFSGGADPFTYKAKNMTLPA
jgi:hypothetical protein